MNLSQSPDVPGIRELLDAAGDSGPLLTAIVLFGFAPGAVLRPFLLLYPSRDRRRQLIEELYTRAWLVRPFWVAQQIETALFEGTAARLNRVRQRCATKKVARVQHRANLARLHQLGLSYEAIAAAIRSAGMGKGDQLLLHDGAGSARWSATVEALWRQIR